ncbi:Ig-like domain-containing protein [Fuerstiella marisgermanici]|uniref:SbsA Ig-like domain-containing protein n=1 Tax=Fuerstiella marisgermanici TaxID=1891926 RepID=A0A1P8WM58_9PLAN|nr:Ig-like domain-containing protein [Fuerstiella marisgermanici]APZ95134.1 hypothetical protein Fuma_04789 [Fuerstiella marisgermanici]
MKLLPQIFRAPAQLRRRRSANSRSVAEVAQAVELLQQRTLLAAAQTFSPVDGSQDVLPDTNLVITFDESVQKGNGNFVIVRGTDNSVFETIPVTSPFVSINGNQLVVDLPGNLDHATEYFVQIDPAAVLDLEGNTINGINGPFTWRFSTMTDVSVVPFWDGDATFPQAESATHNLFGGPAVASDNITVRHETSTVRGGEGALRADVLIAESGFGFFGPALAGFGPDSSYIDTRDITPFEQLEFQIKNETNAPFTLKLELKDYRDLNQVGTAHRASTSFSISADNRWTSFSVPLDLANQIWDISGSPDLTRARQVLFVVEAGGTQAVGGSIFVDEVNFIEPGGPVSINSLSNNQLLARLAERSFRSLWGSRDQATGLVPAVSTFADQMGLNSTAMLVRTLPGAVERGWITKTEAESYGAKLLTTLNSVMNDSQHLPPRTLDRVTLEPIGQREESSVDAAFMFLGLTQFAATPGLSSTLATGINNLLDRFDFSPFSSANGWKLAFTYDVGARTGELTAGTYDGYSTEVYVISLAAHLAETGHVDITTQFHSANRIPAVLNGGNDPYLVHPSTEFRSPFLQWLFPLFVDVQNRGLTTYPDQASAINPFDNAVRYQLDVNQTLAARGLPLQLDAADDGTGNRYITASAFNNFGEPNLTMPWSSGFVLAADSTTAGSAIRDYVSQSLVGPFGPVDSARLSPQSATATSYNGRYDLWNSSLWLAATLEHLYDDNALLTNQTEVDAALDKVFVNSGGSGPAGDVDGDSDFDASDSFLIHLVKLSGTNVQIDQSKGSSTLSGADIRSNINQLGLAADVDGSGEFTASDSFLIQLVKLSGTNSQIDQSKGASSLTAAQIRINVNALGDAGGGSASRLSRRVAGSGVSNAASSDASLATYVSSDAPDQSLFATAASLPPSSVNGQVLDTPPEDSDAVLSDFRCWIDAIHG